MSAPLVPHVIAASVQIQSEVSLVIVLEPGTKEIHVNLVNTVEQQTFTLTLKYINTVDSFTCNCTGTGYEGNTCQIGKYG